MDHPLKCNIPGCKQCLHPVEHVEASDAPVTQAKPGFQSKLLGYDYKRPHPPSATFTKARPFSHLKKRAEGGHDPDLRGSDWLERFVVEYDTFSPLNRIFKDGELDIVPSGSTMTKTEKRLRERRMSTKIRGKYLLLKAILKARHEEGKTWADITAHLGVTEYKMRALIQELSELFGKEELRYRRPETRPLDIVPKPVCSVPNPDLSAPREKKKLA